MKKNKNILLIVIVLIIFFFFIPNFFINLRKDEILKKEYYSKNNKDMLNFIEGKKVYTVMDVFKLSSYDAYNVEINISNYEKVTFNKNVNYELEKKGNISDKIIIIKLNNKEIYKGAYINNISINLDEGINNIEICIFDNEKLLFQSKNEVYYISDYKHQFAEKLSKYGVVTQYINGSREDYNKSNQLLKKLGAINVKGEICLSDYDKNKENYKWIRELENDSEINVLLLLNISPYKIDNNEIIKRIDEFIKKLNKEMGVTDIELLNENNFRYKSDDEISWYVKCMNYLIKNNKDIMILPSTNDNSYEDSRKISSKSFYEKYNNLDSKKIINNYNIHPYSFKSEEELLNKINLHKDLIINNGGFINLNVTEYGITTYIKDLDQQSEMLVKQSVLMSKNVKYKYLYDLWSTDAEGGIENYGLIDNDYLPRKSYFSMKTFYKNTNGSEYIGSINLHNGLESHVYNKDGKVKIITWSMDENNPVIIDFKDFTATDLYGNPIENTDGKLTISSSPVYLDNVSASYFYQAISNSITSGYSEFNIKFADNISKVSGLSNKIANLNTYVNNLKDALALDETIAKTLMKNHFELGNELINAYNNGILKVEYVQLSSMLDYLNTIGNSYEDLVTVSAKTRMNDLSEVSNSVQQARLIINNNDKIEIVYPEKILRFAQDFLDDSSYVLGLEEENDIKTGLINSKALHAKYLANWSSEFSEIYIRDNKEKSTDKIKLDNENVKKQHNIIYENKDISIKYNELINGLNQLSVNFNENNQDKIDNIYSKQIELIKEIVYKKDLKEIKIDNSEYKILLEDLVNVSEDYKNLYYLYFKEDYLQENKVIDEINKIINRYDKNLNYDLSNEMDLIKQLKELYSNLKDSHEEYEKYFTKQKLVKISGIVSMMLENDIKEQTEKNKPIINVKDGEFLKIDVSGNDIQQIKVEKDKKAVNVENGKLITTPGIYKITAINKLGNFNTVESIVYGIYTSKSGTQIKYITIKPETVVKEVEENSKFKIIKNNENSFITTGDSLINENETYKIVVIGDINQQGKVNVKDVVTFRKAFIGLENLTDMQFLAADTDRNSKIDLKDLIKIKKIIVGME